MAYEPLNENTVIDYVKKTPDIMNVAFQEGDTLQGVDLADGNLNQVFRVSAAQDPDRSVIVKQALPYVRVVGPSFPVPLERAIIEAGVLAAEAEHCPDYVPRVYHADSEMFTVVMEDLKDLAIMREGMMKQVEYPHFAQHIGIFMARSLFYTSDLYLDHKTKKEQVAKYINPHLCKITEDLVFTDGYSPTVTNNDSNPELEPQAAEIRGNNALRARFYMLKEEFMTKAEALIHGDLHTGSIMVNQEKTKVIDPEFGFYGPMAFDTGLLMANFVLSYASQEHHAPNEATRKAYRGWLTSTMREIWGVFETEFRRLWDEDLNPQWETAEFRELYIARLLKYTAGYGAAETMRRILNWAHVPDLRSITDDKERAYAESMALNVGVEWVMNYEKYNTIDDLVRVLENAKSSYPYS
ncbi:MAG: S-methyl-5-thioribose kinase [Anaerolineales bacterium]